MFGSMQAFVNKAVIVSYNLNGTVRHMLNLSEYKKWLMSYLKTMSPMLDMSKMADTINDSSAIDAIDNTGIFSLYGKDLKTGNTDVVNINGIKGKRTYTVSVDGKKIDMVYTSIMTGYDVKKIVIDQLKKGGMTDQALQIEEQWPIMHSMGMDKVEVRGNETDVFGDDGWISSLSTYSNISMMGMKTEMKSMCTVK
jgi:hypothetical protein